MSDREARVDLAAVTTNVAKLCEQVGDSQVMAVVKQDAYGHGAIPCARAALDGGATWLGVAHIDEALQLRQAGLTVPILCLMAVPGEEHEDAIRAGVTLTAGSAQHVATLAAAAERASAGQPATVHLKADTGLSRGGATRADWPALLDAARHAQRQGLLRVTGLWSHFACSDEPGHPSIKTQLAAFDEALAVAAEAGISPEIRHMANTAAALTVPESRFDLVRFGGAIYGLSTLPGGAPSWLRPAMTLRARLAAVKRVPAGTGVSYGYRYVTDRETTLGLVPLGYADGIRRAATGHALVSAHGRRWLIVGTVCMDQFVVDFGDEPVAPGDEVVLFGPGDNGEPTAQEWGDALGGISYEIALSVGPRVPKTFTHNEPDCFPAEPSLSTIPSLNHVESGMTARPAAHFPTAAQTVLVPTDDDMRALGRRLAAQLRAGDLLILSGPLGAGKTTLAQGIGAGLGVRGLVTSPTFVISRVHPGPVVPLVHVDAYRLGSFIEIDDLDLDTANSVTVVEWGEGLAESLAEDRLEISITPDPDSSQRTVRIRGFGARWDAVLAATEDRL
jgi:alanine racemase